MPTVHGRWWLHDALPLTALLAARAGIQLAARPGTVLVARIAEAAIDHLLHASLDQAALHEDVATPVPVEGARGVAHDQMGVVLAADDLTQRPERNRRR